MDERLEAVAFLARSANRVAVLRALADAPRDRRDLEAATGVSRSTLSRTLADFEDRGWVRRDGGTYAATTAGSLVVERFVALLETVGGLRTLGEGIEYLPVEEMALDVRRFDDARLVTPTEFDPTAAFEYGVDRMRESAEVVSVARTVPPAYVRALHEDVVGDGPTVVLVLDGAYLDAVDDPDLARRWRDIAADAEVRRYEGYVPYRLIVLETVVHLWLCSDAGDQVGLLESEDPVVREWAESTVASYRDDARPLEPEAVA